MQYCNTGAEEQNPDTMDYIPIVLTKHRSEDSY